MSSLIKAKKYKPQRPQNEIVQTTKMGSKNKKQQKKLCDTLIFVVSDHFLVFFQQNKHK